MNFQNLQVVSLIVIALKNRVKDTSKPIVIITYIAVNSLIWTRYGTSSATATFTVSGTDYCITANASPTVINNVTAANCLEKDETSYTSFVNINSKTYADTKTVEGAAGPYSYTYSQRSENTVTEKFSNCNNRIAMVTLTATNTNHTGSAIIKGVSITYSNG